VEQEVIVAIVDGHNPIVSGRRAKVVPIRPTQCPEESNVHGVVPRSLKFSSQRDREAFVEVEASDHF
jgi:hypothetical protein